MSHLGKKFTNHSARKTLVKKLRKEHLPKSEIITITGHKTEAGLDAYDSGDEDMQREISLAIDKAPSSSSTATATTSKMSKISPNDQRLKSPNFSFFPRNQSETFKFSSNSTNFNNIPPNFNFNFSDNAQCTIKYQISSNQSTNVASPPPKKRRRVIYSSESSQE